MNTCPKIWWAVILTIILAISYEVIINNQAVTAETQDLRFKGVETGILVRNFTTPYGSLTANFTVNNVKPFLYDPRSLFEVKYNVIVQWDTNAVAAAYVPAVLEVYEKTNPSYNGTIIIKRPTLVGLSAVFRGSNRSGTTLDTEWEEKYQLYNGTLYLHIAIGSKTYEREIEVFMEENYDEKAILEAWMQARAGISADLKLLDFVKASFDLASIEAGVKASIVSKYQVSNGYRVRVKFTIPTYEIRISYYAGIDVERLYNAYSMNGSNVILSRGELPEERKTTTESEMDRWTLGASGYYVGYSDYIDMIPYSGIYQFDANGSTGMIVYMTS
ncbi:MAG: hypothetical protein QXP97_00135 [Desulfurococcus sp.]